MGQDGVELCESGKKPYKMGVVDSPLVSRQLMLQYLSGAKPLSPSLRDSCIEGFINL